MSHSDATFERTMRNYAFPFRKSPQILLLTCCRVKRFYGTQARKQDLNKTE